MAQSQRLYLNELLYLSKLNSKWCINFPMTFSQIGNIT